MSDLCRSQLPFITIARVWVMCRVSLNFVSVMSTIDLGQTSIRFGLSLGHLLEIGLNCIWIKFELRLTTD